MLQRLKILAESLANFIFPPYCSSCHKKSEREISGGVCPGCWESVARWEEGCCQRCGKPLAQGSDINPALCPFCRIPDWGCSDVRTIGPFKAPLSDAIHRLKYSDARSISRRLGKIMADIAGNEERYRQADIILAVPLHNARKRERGYNQAQLLADQLGKELKIPSRKDIIFRARHTKSQTTLNKVERLRNVEGIFRVKSPEKIKDKTIILIDDVLTTGATIGSCGQSLIKAGAKQVLAMTAAAAPL